MSLLSDDDKALLVLEHLGPAALAGDTMSLYDCFQLALDVAEKAVLAKLASAELPEPVANISASQKGCIGFVRPDKPYYTAAQLHEAHAQGFAAGAASQLSAEPVAFTDEDFMHIFVSADIAQDCGATIELYTWRQANDRLHKAD